MSGFLNGNQLPEPDEPWIRGRGCAALLRKLWSFGQIPNNPYSIRTFLLTGPIGQNNALFLPSHDICVSTIQDYVGRDQVALGKTPADFHLVLLLSVFTYVKLIAKPLGRITEAQFLI